MSSSATRDMLGTSKIAPTASGSRPSSRACARPALIATVPTWISYSSLMPSSCVRGSSSAMPRRTAANCSRYGSARL